MNEHNTCPNCGGYTVSSQVDSRVAVWDRFELECNDLRACTCQVITSSAATDADREVVFDDELPPWE